MPNHAHDSRLRPTDDLEVDCLGPIKENQILLVVSFRSPRLKVRPAQPGDEGPVLIAKQSSPDARTIRAVTWKGVPTDTPAGEPKALYLAADGGYTATRPKSKVRVVGWAIEGVDLLGLP